MNSDFKICAPQTPEDFSQYYDLRWRILRAPWGQPRGSEKDTLEDQSVHLLARNSAKQVIGVARLHFNSSDEAQIRYMAIEDSYRKHGIGSRLLAELEAEAKEKGAETIFLNARENTESFYLAHGYQTIGNGELLFCSIAHKRMTKSLQSI